MITGIIKSLYNFRLIFLEIKMVEENGYGSRIYVQKRKRFRAWPYILVVAIFIGTWFILKSLHKTPAIPKSIHTKTQNKNTGQRKIRPTKETKTPRPAKSVGNSTGDENRKEELQSEDKPLTPNLEERLKAAHQYYMNKEFEKALALYKEIDDQTPEAILYEGLCYYWLEDFDNAYQYLQQILNNDSRNFLARKFMALTCYKMDDLSNCLIHIELALSQVSDPELMELHDKIKREQKVMNGYGDQKKVHFKVQFSKDEQTGIENTVLDILEEAYRTIGSDFNYYPPSSITVILYNEKNFFDVTRAPGWAGGLYDGKIRIPIHGIEGQDALLKRILFHEFTHALVVSITPACPVWLNEGLAEYFSEDEELLNIGRQIGQLIPLKYLERGFPSDPRAVAVAYLESYTAVSDLIERHGLFRVKECLEALNKDSLSNAFRTIFGITYEEFTAKWGYE